jgi:hypothetical protein
VDQGLVVITMEIAGFKVRNLARLKVVLLAFMERILEKE